MYFPSFNVSDQGTCNDDAVFYYICSEYIEFMVVQNVGNVYLQST